MAWILFLIVTVASLLTVDHLAHARGWNRSRWQGAALALGPLAIPFIYLADIAYAVHRRLSPRRH